MDKETKRAEKETLQATSFRLRDILKQWQEGKPVFQAMAKRIEARETERAERLLREAKQ